MSLALLNPRLDLSELQNDLSNHEWEHPAAPHHRGVVLCRIEPPGTIWYVVRHNSESHECQGHNVASYHPFLMQFDFSTNDREVGGACRNHPRYTQRKQRKRKSETQALLCGCGHQESTDAAYKYTQYI